MRIVIGIILFFWLYPMSALSAWVEAKSENFIFVGNVNETKAKTIVHELEEYRRVLFKLVNLKPSPETVPIRIYGARSSSSIQDITGNSGAAGVYKTTHEGPAFITNVKGGFSRGSFARQIAYHEFTHHFLSTFSSAVYPRWYSEGYAEYLSTFEIDKDGRVKLGLPNQARGQALAQLRWYSMDDLLKSVRFYPDENNSKRSTTKQRAIFYAQSWLAVHFIASQKNYSNKITAYLKRLNQPDAPADLFEQSFGITTDKFDELLKAYHKKNSYSYLTLNFEQAFEVPDISIRKLSRGEVEFHRGEAVRRFRVGPKRRELSEKYYKRSEKAGGPLAQISASRAQIASESKDHEAALTSITKALELSPDDSRILQIAGQTHLNNYRYNDGAKTVAEIDLARTYFKKSMRAHPENMQAHYNYVSTYAIANDQPSKQAIYSADECAYYFRSRGFIETNMNLAEVLLKGGSAEKARPLLEKAQVWSISRKTRAYARRALENLN